MCHLFLPHVTSYHRQAAEVSLRIGLSCFMRSCEAFDCRTWHQDTAAEAYTRELSAMHQLPRNGRAHTHQLCGLWDREQNRLALKAGAMELSSLLRLSRLHRSSSPAAHRWPLLIMRHSVCRALPPSYTITLF